MPMEPVSMAASSDRMSPNMLPVTHVELLGRLDQLHRGVVDIHVLELDVRVLLGGTSVTTSFQNWKVSSTLALSTLVTFLLRLRAAWKATWAMRSISGGE